MYSTAFLDLPALRHANGRVRLPGSKSISNRVLLLAGLCAGTTTLHGLLASDDTQVMLDAGYLVGASAYTTLAYDEAVIAGYVERSDTAFAQIAAALDANDFDARLRGPVKHAGFKRLT